MENHQLLMETNLPTPITGMFYVNLPEGNWLVVWNFMFPYIGNNDPNWLSYFSGGLKPPITQKNHIKWKNERTQERFE